MLRYEINFFLNFQSIIYHKSQGIIVLEYYII
jgi:hypothetical protein